jgi:hypothetical protein
LRCEAAHSFSTIIIIVRYVLFGFILKLFLSTKGILLFEAKFAHFQNKSVFRAAVSVWHERETNNVLLCGTLCDLLTAAAPAVGCFCANGGKYPVGKYIVPTQSLVSLGNM